MKKILLATVATLSLAAAVPAFAQDVVVGVESTDNEAAGATIGATGGATTGAVAGGLVGGPIGAVIGGFAGAVLGAEAGVATASVDFASANPVEPIYFDGSADIGYVLPGDVVVYPIQGDPAYGYVYANDRVWIVDLQTRALVQSPGYLVPQTYSDYVLANPVDPIDPTGDLVVGEVLPDGSVIQTIPDSPYGYVYYGDRPAMVDSRTNTVIWIQ
ncbi:MAG: DUF1236 domain-containing protein [Candidatus Devosia phytovorans]|uniref:DUF1236 domain-containing protein n=1 Tax=Candidatus Devosia phytovorans TaxID=3121372 RepID=A0AAJ5VSL4_9HYPH|nr:DUF1236 domain-containing protein [Devosia sp.]WEK04063.1 MAG: DUF1236 domain-containing protein [Devosia sp.]